MEGKELLDKQLHASLEDLEAVIPVTGQSLIAKVAAACNAVGGVAKSGRNVAQNYDYVKAADVAKAIRHELFSRGVVILPHENAPEFIAVQLAPDRDGNPRSMTECHLCVTFNVTDGIETLAFNAYGVARDSGDKAIYKAKTGALKYFLRGLGLIPDEKDDPEFDEDGKPVVKRTKEEQKQFGEEKAKRIKEERKTEPVSDSTSTSNRISDAQRKRMFAISKQHNWEQTALRDLLGSHGFEHSDEVTRDKYDEICKTIEGTV